MRITSFHAVEEALKVPDRVSLIHYSEPVGPRVRRILDQAQALGIRLAKSDKKGLGALAPGQEIRGIVAELRPTVARQWDFATELGRLKNEVDQGEHPVVLVLDGITDPHNLGAILRSADKLGVSLVIYPQKRSASDGPVVSAASAGADQHVAHGIVTNLVRAIEELKEAGFWVWGADLGGQGPHKTDAKVPLVLVMGSEGSGMSRLVKEHCDHLVTIPTTGKVDSFNVSNACAILLYEVWRQRDFSFPAT